MKDEVAAIIMLVRSKQQRVVYSLTPIENGFNLDLNTSTS